MQNGESVQATETMDAFRVASIHVQVVGAEHELALVLEFSVIQVTIKGDLTTQHRKAAAAAAHVVCSDFKKHWQPMGSVAEQILGLPWSRTLKMSCLSVLLIGAGFFVLSTRQLRKMWLSCCRFVTVISGVRRCTGSSTRKSAKLSPVSGCCLL